MAKSKEKITVPSINHIIQDLSKKKLQPIYYLFGEDRYSIDQTIREIKRFVEPLILSEFDKEIIEPEKKQKISPIIDIAMSFPFGGGKKLLVINNFEKIDDKNLLVDYISFPTDFTVLIISDYRKINNLNIEPYASLLKRGFLYEAKVEKGTELIGWIVGRSEALNLNITEEKAKILLEITGEDKSLLEMQLQKLSDFSVGKKELTFEEITKLTSPTKQYSIFDLQDALGKGDKSKSIEIAYSLLDAGQDIVMIINMLAKFIVSVAQIHELIRTNIDDNKGAQMMKVTWFYYVNCKKARFFLSDNKLINASRALLDADLMVKTTSTDSKNIILFLISSMLK